jgi:hypothetical protein
VESLVQRAVHCSPKFEFEERNKRQSSPHVTIVSGEGRRRKNVEWDRVLAAAFATGAVIVALWLALLWQIIE